MTWDLRVPSEPKKNAARPRVLEALLANGDAQLTFDGLAAYAGASPRTITGVVRDLEPLNVLRRRPLRFGCGAGLVLSFEIGVEDLRGGLVDANGKMFCDYSADPDPSQLDGPPSELLRRLRKVARRVLDAGFADPELTDSEGRLQLLGATAAWPCAVGRDGFAHGHAFANREWYAVRLKQRLSAALGGPFTARVAVDAINAANAAVMAVVFDRTRARWLQQRAGEHSEIAMVVRLQGGISAGTMQVAPHLPGKPLAFLESRLVVGSSGFAGELGHLPMSPSVVRSINEDRPAGLARIAHWPCSCGQPDHLEGMASARGLLRRLRESKYEVAAHGPIGQQITSLTGTPDAVLARAQSDIGRLLGRALASPILMLDPASITITGYLARSEVVAGVSHEQHRWDIGVARGLKIDFLEDEANLQVERRGAALAMFRRLVYRKLDKLCDTSLRAGLIVPVSRDDLRGLAELSTDGD